MGLGIVRRRTKLTEGSHRGLHSSGIYADMLLLLLFYVFTFFFKIQKVVKVVTFYVFLPCPIRLLELRI